MLEQEVMIQSLVWGWIAEMSDQEATAAKGIQWKYNCPFFLITDFLL